MKFIRLGIVVIAAVMSVWGCDHGSNAVNKELNNVRLKGIVSGRLEAEDFINQQGIKAESCSEGGENIGWINDGDWAEYEIDAASSGTYIMSVRVASNNNGGTINVAVDGQQAGIISVPGTGGWQTWTTVNGSVNIPSAGKHTLRLSFSGGSGYLFNINWLEFEGDGDDADDAPSNITNLSAQVVDCNTVSLSWSDTTGEEAYRIRRRVQGKSYVILDDIPANSTSYTDETAVQNTSYEYMVRPMVDGTAAAISNVPSVTTPSCGGGDPDTGRFPGGRIALSFDGNIHDPDDIIAMPMSLAMLYYAGLSNHVVHIEYGNNVCGTENDLNNEMSTSAQGSMDHWGYSDSVMFHYTEVPTQATQNLIAEINKSSSDNLLWIVAGGPMESVWRALNGANASKRQHVVVISHSKWNENYPRDRHYPPCSRNQDYHTWSDMKRDFEGDGVFFVESCGDNGCTAAQRSNSNYLPDQNTSNGDNDFNTPINKWHWLRDHNNSDLRWLFGRNPFNNKFDPSDAGMVFFLLDGGPWEGGCKTCGWRETQELFSD